MTDSFFNLTPDVVLTALEADGLEPTGHIMTLNSYENRVYDLKLADDTHVVSKFYRPGRWSREQIREEHEFLFEIRDSEIPVCAPREFPDGDTVHETDGIFYAVWPRTGGRSKNELSDAELGILGRLLARIHNIGAASPARHRIQLNEKTYALDPLTFLTTHHFLPDHLVDRFSGAVNSIAEIYADLSVGVPVHRIHGDCHLGNLLCGTDGWFFLDAYRQFRDFDASWFRLIEPLRALRFIHYSAWIARRWDDPAFRAAFSYFGTTEYWEGETNDLEKQLDYILHHTDGLVPPAPPSEPEPELTNKDFFWDM
ncbi:MAG: serine/threonine protein kinase [Deltaproteobacteria bacterium HGW-Deltaproteobacteria-22]|nr:MAG: serine/threonine protein kinase [Deltaproteobacteria bacterium HGW-Deltaproteobacteria-22]